MKIRDIMSKPCNSNGICNYQTDKDTDYKTKSKTPMIINCPIIKEFRTNEHFGYLWLKYVNGFDLSKHCAKCLIGDYSKAFRYGSNNVELRYYALNEHGAKYFYLCGVTSPYRWNRNLHVAFQYSQGESFTFEDGYTKLEILNARQIPIYARKYYNILHGDEKSYNTCRNWRFAYQMTFGF